MNPEFVSLRRLNLGCGFDRLDGFLNVDNFSQCQPDALLDIEATPWGLPDSHFEYVLIKHVLEHVGADFPTFMRVMQELYRVCAHGAEVEIHVPHYRHETWWSDPTHVRAFTALTFRMMSRRQNDEWVASRAHYTMLAHLMGVDFEIIEALQVYDPAWWKRVESGELTQDQLRALGDQLWGVIKELRVRLRVLKPQ
jgi:SAM-dependent methyltransferase